MKDLMKKGMSFMAFDYLLQPVHIRTAFDQVHTSQQEKIQGWSAAATRQRLIARYWYKYVVQHYALLLLAAMAASFFLSGYQQPGSFLLAVLTAGSLCYLLLYLVLYRHCFSSNFLPILETVKESHEGTKAVTEPICKKAQLSTFSLILIFYVLDKTSGMNALQCSSKFAAHLTKIYGRSPKGVSTSLQFLFVKKKDVKSRKLTEVVQDFQDSYSFFEEMNFEDGISMLRKLEQKILERYQQPA